MSTRTDPRRPPVNDARHEIVDEVADKAYDAIDFGGVDAETVVYALREVADEVESRRVNQ